MAVSFPISCDQGADLQVDIYWKLPVVTPGDLRLPKPLDGYSATMTVRESVDGGDLLDLSTSAGTIIIDGPNGKIGLVIDSDASSGINQSGVYDLFLTSPKITVQTGMVISATTNSITVSGAPFTPNSLIGEKVNITAGIGQHLRPKYIIANSPNGIVIGGTWDSLPVSGSSYEAYAAPKRTRLIEGQFLINKRVTRGAA
jgi:hypothetical protein